MQAELIRAHRLITQGASISTDTRQINKGDLFFALKGENFDANKFALQAIEKGAIAAVVDDPGLPAHKSLIKVNDVLSFLHQLASYHRSLFSIPVIGITGSNGKTTTKELINAVLSRKFTTLCTKGNLNNHIGVPLTLLGLRSEHQLAIIEMGANHVGEIAMLSELARPGFGIITNIGKAHIEGFGSFANIITAKTELYRFIKKNGGLVFLNGDNEILSQEAAGLQCITYGTLPENTYRGNPIASSPFLTISYQLPGGSKPEEATTVHSNLLGAYNFENIMTAVTIGLYFEIPPADIKAAIEQYSPKNSRSQLLQTSHNTLVMDAYNANPTSMKAALSNFSTMDTPLPKAVILGDMLELGEVSSEEHLEILRIVEMHQYSIVILVGDQFSKVATDRKNYNVFENTDEAEIWLGANPIRNHTVLLKGSRGIALEKLTGLL